MYGFTWIEASYITVASCRISLLLTLFLYITQSRHPIYSYYNTKSLCVQYSHATLVLILMAVDQKDIEHCKDPVVQIFYPITQLLIQYT